MSCRVDTTALIAACCVVSAFAGHGIRGDAVPSTGTHGPSPVYNDLALPADTAKEYRWAIVTPPAVGTLVIFADCSYSYTPPPGTVDLTVTYTYRLWEDGVDMGTAVETIVIGAGSGAINAAAAITLAPLSLAATATMAGGGGGGTPVNASAALTLAPITFAAAATAGSAPPSGVSAVGNLMLSPITFTSAAVMASMPFEWRASARPIGRRRTSSRTR